MGAMVSQIARLTKFCLLLKQFIQAKIKENFKALRHWPLCGEFTGDHWGTIEFPAQMVGNAENVSILWRHHVKLSSRPQCLSLATVW